MNILYLSCHSILEYEEMKLLADLGHQVLSIGSYVSPSRPIDRGADRPALPGLAEFPELVPLLPEKWDERINDKITAWADAIIDPGIPSWLEPNEHVIDKFIFRSIGQSRQDHEDCLMNYVPRLKIVRYSPAERRIPCFAGEDAVIRFYKDPEVYKGWVGGKNEVVTVSQAFKKRREGCGYDVFKMATTGLPRAVYGRGNGPEDGELWIHGELPFEELLKVYRSYRVFFYTGTVPAQYTLAFMEAWMTGIPVVAAGPKILRWDTEMPELIDDGENGFISNDIATLRDACKLLLGDHSLAKDIGAAGRKKAMEVFNYERIKGEWKAFLEGWKRG